MVDLAVLEKSYGVSADAWKKLLNTDPFMSKDDDSPLGKFKDQLRSRIQAGRDFNLSNHSLYYAMDLAWDSPFHQITPTLLTSLVDKPVSGSEVTDAFKSWGLDLNQVMEEYPDPKTPGKTLKRVNVPAFFKIFPPLVRAYVTMRWAKIMNDRQLVPFFKFEPSVSDEISRLRGEAITKRIEVMTQQLGYFEIVKEAVWRMLHYGQCLQFVQEEWYSEEQVLSKDTALPGEDATVGGKVVGKTVVVKEGLRYHLPHPTRTYFDRSSYPVTFNTDSGCDYAGYWRIMRYKDIAYNKNFYNTARVTKNQTDFWTTNNTFFVTVYRGCAMNFPSVESASGGTSRLDNEKHIADQYYNRSMDDAAVLVTEHFERIVPKDVGLGDYPNPIWARFVAAGDGTIIYAAPLPCTPVVYYGYDDPGGRTQIPSMTMEILPFQDQVGNLLTQTLLSMRQNLANLVLIDTDQIETGFIDTIKNIGETLYRGLNIFGFSSKKAAKAGNTVPEAVQSFRFPQQNTVELINGLRTILDLLERVLVMSSQEVAQAASHEQTREEVRNIAGSSSTRLQFTAAAVDSAREAMKRQLYYSLMSYGVDEFYVQIPIIPVLTKEELAKLGFTVKSTDHKNGNTVFKVQKTAVMYESWISNRDGDDRINDMETAKAMTAFVGMLLQNPMTMQAIGPDQAIKICNYIGKMAGFPRDFKLENMMPKQLAGQPGQPGQPQAGDGIPPAIHQALDQIAAHIEQDVQGAVTHIIDTQKQQAQQLAGIQSIVQLLATAAHLSPNIPQPNALDATAPTTPGVQSPSPQGMAIAA